MKTSFLPLAMAFAALAGCTPAECKTPAGVRVSDDSREVGLCAGDALGALEGSALEIYPSVPALEGFASDWPAWEIHVATEGEATGPQGRFFVTFEGERVPLLGNTDCASKTITLARNGGAWRVLAHEMAHAGERCKVRAFAGDDEESHAGWLAEGIVPAIARVNEALPNELR